MSIIRKATMCRWYNMDIVSYFTWNNSCLEEEKNTNIFGCSFGDLKVLVLVKKEKWPDCISTICICVIYPGPNCSSEV